MKNSFASFVSSSSSLSLLGRIPLLAKSSIVSLVVLLNSLNCALLNATPASASDRIPAWGQDVIYQIVTDRFFDGDKTNNDPAVSRGMFDPEKKNWHQYWGGDLKGIESKLDYLQKLGVTTIWMSPPFDNIDKGAMLKGKPVSPYHGYHIRDFTRIEEHFGDSSKSFRVLDELIAQAHKRGMKVVIDFVANHSNESNQGERGALYENGGFVTDFESDHSGIFHRGPNITDWNDLYKIQYDTLFYLADFNQENAFVDSYLKRAARLMVSHQADAFRLDAIKHATWGWMPTLADDLHRNKPTPIFGEWWASTTTDTVFAAGRKFGNRSGISLIDFPLCSAIQDAWDKKGKGSFVDIRKELDVEDAAFDHPEKMITFIDNHDMSRFLNRANDNQKLHQALAMIFLMRGIPVLLYGTEQYLVDHTDEGADPYNRPMMTEFDESKPAYKLVAKLASLRKQYPLLAFGKTTMLAAGKDLLVFRRSFAGQSLVVAFNKGNVQEELDASTCSIPEEGSVDLLGGTIGGVNIGPKREGLSALIVPGNSVSVWLEKPTGAVAAIGTVEPAITFPGATIQISGLHFGNVEGTVKSGDTTLPIKSWSDTVVTCTIPKSIIGMAPLTIGTKSGEKTNDYKIVVNEAPRIPVTINVNHVPAAIGGSKLYVQGNTVGLGNWSQDPDRAEGPMIKRPDGSFTIVAPLPEHRDIQYQVFAIDAAGTVTIMPGEKHSVKTESGHPQSVSLDWQTNK